MPYPHHSPPLMKEATAIGADSGAAERLLSTAYLQGGHTTYNVTAHRSRDQ